MAAKRKKKAATSNRPVPTPWLWAGGVLVVILAVWIGVAAGSRPAEPEVPEVAGVETYPIQSVDHVASVNSPHEEYNSDPPTSGPHVAGVARPGFYEEPIEPELLVHNLEHGNVIIYYRPDAAAETKEQLKSWAGRYTGPSRGVVVVPREDPEHEVILTAWGALLRLKEYDPARAEAFIDRYLNRGPERLE